jgi:hypothetical protein
MEPVKRSTDSPTRLPLLLGVAVVLAGVFLWDRWSGWGTGTSLERGQTPRIHAGAEPSSVGGEGSDPVTPEEGARPLALLALDELRDTIRRPLFERTRRPVEPPQPRAAAVPAPPAAIPRRAADPNALTLLGVLTSEGGGAIALLRRNPTGQNVRLQEGDTVDGWTIERIEPDAVLIKQGDTKLALQLFRKR